MVCIEGDCQYGRQRVLEMKTLYDKLAAGGSGYDVNAFIAHFQAPVAVKVAALDAEDTFWVHWVPFHPGCCSIADVGKEAQDIINQMNAFAGVAASTPPQPPGSPLSGVGDLLATLVSIVKWGAIVGAIGVGMFAAYEGYQLVRSFDDGPPRRKPLELNP